MYFKIDSECLLFEFGCYTLFVYNVWKSYLFPINHSISSPHNSQAKTIVSTLRIEKQISLKYNIFTKATYTIYITFTKDTYTERTKTLTITTLKIRVKQLPHLLQTDFLSTSQAPHTRTTQAPNKQAHLSSTSQAPLTNNYQTHIASTSQEPVKATVSTASTASKHSCDLQNTYIQNICFEDKHATQVIIAGF